MAQQDRFTGTARAHQDKDLPGMNIQVDAIEDDLGAEGFSELADSNGHAGFSGLRRGHGF